MVKDAGAGPKPEADDVHDLAGAVVTPGLVNTHHHLWQNLTRARAQDENLFGWLKALYPVWSAIDEEAEYAAARAGLAELALSGCTTVFDHHYLFPPRREGAARSGDLRRTRARRAHRRPAGSMDLGESQGGLPPDAVVETRDEALAATEAAAGLADGAQVEITVAPCSPFSVTRELMTESAELARRLGLRLHTHLAETVEEEDVLPRALRLHAGRVPRRGRLARRGRLVRALRAPLGRRRREVRRARRRRRALPDVQHAPRRGHRTRARPARRQRARRPGRRRLRLERARRPLPRGEAGAARRACPRRPEGDEPPRGATARRRVAARQSSAATTSASSRRGSAPTPRSGGRTASSSGVPTIPSPASSSPGRTEWIASSSAARRSSARATSSGQTNASSQRNIDARPKDSQNDASRSPPMSSTSNAASRRAVSASSSGRKTSSPRARRTATAASPSLPRISSPASTDCSSGPTHRSSRGVERRGRARRGPLPRSAARLLLLVRDLPRQLSVDDLSELFEGRTRLVEKLAQRDDPLA